VLEAMTGAMASRTSPSTAEPWYRNPDAWLVAAAVLLPFGWVLGLCRVAWAYGSARRRRGKS
jgi:hypothetical protein